MKLLLDNTLVHRVGRVLDSPDSSAIRSIDALALFHFAEHILFCDETLVSTIEPNVTLERTGGVIEKLASRGVLEGGAGAPLLRLEAFSEPEYLSACESAGWGVLDELTGVTAKELVAVGKLADEAVRPEGIPAPTIDNWLADPTFLEKSSQRVANLMSLRSTGSYELTILLCRPLFETLAALRTEMKGFGKRHEAAIGALIRVHVNQQLAGMREGVAYAPAPQRTRISHAVDQLFRQRVERTVRQEVAKGNQRLNRTLERLCGPDLLPLPLFAFHAFRGQKLGSPDAILDAARLMRDDSEIMEVRKWLTEWEQRQASSDPETRLTALGELNRFADEIGAQLKGESVGILAGLHIGGTFSAEPMTGEIGWSPPIPSLGEIKELVTRRHQRQRRFLAALAGELTSDEQLGARVLQQLHRSLKG